MKDLTLTYDTKDAGISGTFTRLDFPELSDYAETIALALMTEESQQACGECGDEQTIVQVMAEIIASIPLVKSTWYGFIRQVFVTWRAEAKRKRTGNKTSPAMSEDAVSKYMSTASLPTYEEPTEVVSTEDKAANALKKALGDNPTPEDIARLLAKAGINYT